MGIPVSISSVICFMLPAHIMKAEGQGLFNMYLEFLIRRWPSKLIAFMRESKVTATIIFSVLHSCIMFGFLKKSSKCFWFSSFKVRDENVPNESNNKCRHIHGESSCDKYLNQVIKTLSCELKALELQNSN